jgi:superfamily II DNA helicase RecQ
VVVVCPLNMIKQGMAARAEKAGIPCWQWDSTCLQADRLGQLTHRPQKGLLLVSADMATNGSFAEFLLHQFAVHKCVARLFMDEVHIVLSEFRDVVFDVHAIRPPGCTWVFLTATLPPDLELLICDITATTPTILRPDVSGFGTGTARLNLEYAVGACVFFFGSQIWLCVDGRGVKKKRAHKLFTSILWNGAQVLKVPQPSVPADMFSVIISALLSTSERPGCRGIVFVSSTSRCDEIHDAVSEFAEFTVVKYHARMSEEDRKLSYSAFTSPGHLPVAMIATTAAGASLDDPRVDFTLHDGMVYGDENLAQETGRAGRGGQPALCVLLADTGTQARFYQHKAGAAGDPRVSALHTLWPAAKMASFDVALRTFGFGLKPQDGAFLSEIYSCGGWVLTTALRSH